MEMIKKQHVGLLLAVLLAAMAAAAAQGVPLTDKDLESEESMRSLYERWRVVHTVPRDLAEEESKFEVFKTNARYINDFNKKDMPYKLGLNKFADMTLEEFTSKYTGAKVLPDDAMVKGVVVDSSEQAVGDVPSSWDWRDHGAVTPVKDQASCNSCWAFSVVGSIEGINAIVTGNLLTLSEQQVLDCSGAGDCRSGGYTYDAFDYAIKQGITTDQCGKLACYPAYEAKKKSCRAVQGKHPVVKINGKARVPYGNEAALKQRVYAQPVSVLIEASRDLQLYKEGVFGGACGTAQNHAVVAVGYGEAQDRTKYWIVKNSWGTGWGEKGYVRMKRNVAGRGEGTCGIAMYPMYPIKK